MIKAKRKMLNIPDDVSERAQELANEITKFTDEREKDGLILILALAMATGAQLATAPKEIRPAAVSIVGQTIAQVVREYGDAWESTFVDRPKN